MLDTVGGYGAMAGASNAARTVSPIISAPTLSLACPTIALTPPPLVLRAARQSNRICGLTSV